jgi:dihydrofolate synthase/folylpolyglutamate synthase
MNPEDQFALSEIEQILNRFTHFGVELGLERIERLLDNLGNPQRQVPILHVAGSNGKGSVCAYLSSILTQAGYRVGRYTSPHLVDWTERISLNEQAIAPTELHHYLLQVLAAIRPDQPSPTQFEVITAVAWLYFAQQPVDIAVIEVGLGGRLDATNVCDRPLVSVITSLSREHWQKLGPTLADISREKAGILKPGCPAVIAPLPPEAEPVIKQRIAELGCPVIYPEPSVDLGDGWAEYRGGREREGIKDERERIKDERERIKDEGERIKDQTTSSETSSSFILHPSSFIKYPLTLLGAHQLINSALAIATIQILQSQGWAISLEAIVEGMAKTRWVGRMQWLTWEGQPLLIDGAHNPAGAEMLRRYVESSDRVTRPVNWVMGMLQNKDHADVFRALLRPGDRLFLVPVPDHLTAKPEELSNLAYQICPDLQLCCSAVDVFAGLGQAFQQVETDRSRTTTILCGSLYLLGSFLKNATVSS